MGENKFPPFFNMFIENILINYGSKSLSDSDKRFERER